MKTINKYVALASVLLAPLTANAGCDLSAYYGPTATNYTTPIIDHTTGRTALRLAAQNADDITTCDVSNMTNFDRLFYNVTNFNQDLSAWDVSNVNYMFYVFANTSFNQDISGWDVSSATNMEGMFWNSPFNRDISNWDVSNVTTMKQMFYQSSFNQNISGWDVSNVTNFDYMFRNNTSFNQPIGSWTTSSATSILNMFYGATSFNQNINSWDVSNVTNAWGMFYNATSYNQPLDSWNTGNLTAISSMFEGATSFNQDISSWDTRNVTSFFRTFKGASNFNQNLSTWNFESATFMNEMLLGTSFSTYNYDALLLALSSQTLPNSMSFSAGTVQYSVTAQTARASIISTYGWSIADGGCVSGCTIGTGSGAVPGSDSTAPSITITSAEGLDGFSSEDAVLNLTFTSSEATTNFTETDITVSNGSISNFAAISSTVFTATLTPTAVGDVTIDVAAGTFTDAANNNNIAAIQFNWSYGRNPLTKKDVVAGVNASVSTATKFARINIESISNRLNWLRKNKDSTNKSIQGVKIAFTDPLLNQFANGDPRALDAFKQVSTADVLQKYGQNPHQVMSDVQTIPIEIAMAEAQKKFGKVDVNPTGGKVIGDWYLWTAGQVTLGKTKNRSLSVDNESEALNLAIGMDKSDKESMLGFAVNGSKDMTDIGTDGSKQKSYGASLSIYGGFDTDALPPIELILGVGHMDIKSTRIDGSQTLTGSRGARTVFGSVGVLAETIEKGKVTITPYGKLEAAYIELGSYSESGGSLALAYDKHIVKQAMVKLGVDANYDTEWMNGKLTPFTRLEYAYDISPSSDAGMHYVGDSTEYRLTTDKSAVSNWAMGLGADYAHTSGASTSIFYQRTESINSGRSDSVQLKVSITF